MELMEKTHIVEIMREAGPEGASVEDIASKVTEIRRAKDPEAQMLDSAHISEFPHASANRAALQCPLSSGHVLRLLATYHFVQEVKPDVFANNRLSSFIDSGKSTEQLKSS